VVILSGITTKGLGSGGVHADEQASGAVSVPSQDPPI
jgi:hypothetical protein